MRNFIVIGYLIFFSCFNLLPCFSQELVSTAGDVFENPHVQMEWSLGEMMIETISHESICLTQGFHQPLVMESDQPRLPIKVMPNPFDLFVIIELPDLMDENLYASIYDINGRLIFIIRDLKERNLIDTSDLTDGVYVIYIHDGTSRVIFYDKIIKYEQP